MFRQRASACVASLLLAAEAFESIVRPEFSDMQTFMAEYEADGFDWQNHEVHTDDGYILNIFRLRRGDQEPSMGEPVLIMHGLGCNGAQTLHKISDEFDPMPIFLAKAGFDVWLGNSRGNQFSSEHETLDWALDEAKYWDFSFPEMAENDLPAIISTIQEESGFKMIKYIGYSLSTTELFYALQSPNTQAFMQESVSRAIALAPILIPRFDGEDDFTNFEFQTYMSAFSTYDLDYQVFGPQFDERVSDACGLIKFFGYEQDDCDSARSANDGLLRWEPISTKIIKHYSQIFLQRRFQEYSDCYKLVKCHETELIPVDQIQKVPITLIFGELDTISEIEIQANLLYVIPTDKQVLILPDYDHASFMNDQPDTLVSETVKQLLEGTAFESDPKWMQFVQERTEELEELERQRLEEIAAQLAKEQAKQERREWIADSLTPWDNFGPNSD